jgi:hypothetical protein
MDDTDPALDLIRTSIPDGKPIWTENIAFWMHDPRAAVRLYAHLGRMQPDRSIWEGLSIIFLPNGEVLVNRSLGVSVAAAENREYRYRPVVPNQTWTYEFDGVMQRVQPERARARPVVDEPVEAASYALVFEAVQPVLNMHRSDLQSERMHLEQGGRVRGSFVIEGRRIAVDAHGYRDHSVSQRTFTTLDSETWANCVFPSGQVFSLLEVTRGDKRILEGQVYRDGRMQHARPVAVPDLTDTAGTPGAFAITLEVTRSSSASRPKRCSRSPSRSTCCDRPACARDRYGGEGRHGRGAVPDTLSLERRGRVRVAGTDAAPRRAVARRASAARRRVDSERRRGTTSRSALVCPLLAGWRGTR